LKIIFIFTFCKQIAKAPRANAPTKALSNLPAGRQGACKANAPREIVRQRADLPTLKKIKNAETQADRKERK
jgi:hypothetical protein